MDKEDPYIGQVIFNAGGDKKEDVWDDTELIEFWDKAKEAYKKHHDQQNKKTPPPPFSMHKNHKRRIEKRAPLKNRSTPVSVPPQQTSPPSLPQVIDGDTFTQMIMAWYYAGYYTGLYVGSSRGATQ